MNCPDGQVLRVRDSRTLTRFGICTMLMAIKALLFVKIAENQYRHNCYFTPVLLSADRPAGEAISGGTMDIDTNRGKRLVGLFLMGYLLFNHPLLSLFNMPKMFFGVPLLYGYIFGVWILLIALMAIISKQDE